MTDRTEVEVLRGQVAALNRICAEWARVWIAEEQEMRPERLQEIREYAAEIMVPHRLGDVFTQELLELVDALTYRLNHEQQAGQIVLAQRNQAHAVARREAHERVSVDQRSRELAQHIERLTGERDRARATAIHAGAFE